MSYQGAGLRRAAALEGRFAGFLRDLRYGARAIRGSPGFTLTALSILGIGIGMATAIFAVFDAVLLRPLPVRSPDEVVVLRVFEAGDVAVASNPEEVRQLRGALRTASEVAGVSHWGTVGNPFMDGERRLTLRAAYVTGNFFDLLDVRPALGRLLRPEDEVANASPTSAMVLSYDTWQREFGGDSTVIGRHLTGPYGFAEGDIIGVAPPGVGYPAGTQYWAPMVPGLSRVVVRLSSGATAETARAEFLNTMRQIRGPSLTLMRAEAETLTDAVLGNARPQLWVLIAAVALLLLIACVNVGNLVLLRVTGRYMEIAVRRSLGAARSDILRPLFWETALLTVMGGLLGLLFAHGLLSLLTRLAPPELPRVDVVSLSAAPIALAAAITVVPILVAALLPAVAATAGDHASPLRATSRSGLSTRGRRRTRQGLVAFQVGLAVVIVASAGLLVRSLDRLTRVPLGFRAENLSVVLIARPADPSNFMGEMVDLYDRVAPALEAVPGVQSISPVNSVPFLGTHTFNASWTTVGPSDADAALRPFVPFEVGGPDYFRTLDIPVLRGRGILDTDVEGAPAVAVVSRAFAERYWPGENPVGQQVRLLGQRDWVTVVGEAGDIRYRVLREATPTVYVPFRQWLFQGRVAIRTSVPISEVLPALESAVREADPEASIARPQEVEELVGEQLALASLSALLVSAFALTALALVAIGLYGVLAAEVRERIRELGVRAALGATPGRLRRMVLARAGVIALAGAAAGLGAAMVGARFLGTVLFEVPPSDPLSFFGSFVLLLIVAGMGAYVPASYATRADPVVALRAE